MSQSVAEIFRLAAAEIPDFILDERAPRLDGSVDNEPSAWATAADAEATPAAVPAAEPVPAPAPGVGVTVPRKDVAEESSDPACATQAAAELNPGGGGDSDRSGSCADAAAGGSVADCATQSTHAVAPAVAATSAHGAS